MTNVENDLTKAAQDVKADAKGLISTAEATVTGLHIGPVTFAIALVVALGLGMGAAVLFGW